MEKEEKKKKKKKKNKKKKKKKDRKRKKKLERQRERERKQQQREKKRQEELCYEIHFFTISIKLHAHVVDHSQRLYCTIQSLYASIHKYGNVN